MKELFALLESTGIEFFYGHFSNTDASMPYGCYRYKMSVDKYADNQNYQDIGRWNIELYAEAKTPALEKKLEDALKGSSIPYQKLEYEIEDSPPYLQIVYEITIKGE